MSKDLFAAFGPPVSENTTTHTKNSSKPSSSLFHDNDDNPVTLNPDPWDSTSTGKQFPIEPQAVAPVHVDLNEDEWGEFEGDGVPPKPSVAVPIASQFSRWLDEEDDGFIDYEIPTRPPGTAWDFTKPDPPVQTMQTRFKGNSEAKVILQRSSLPSRPEPKQAVAQHSRDPNVLFDVEDEILDDDGDDDDDDFGDFEGASVGDPPAPQLVGDFDLLGMHSPVPSVAQKVDVSNQSATAQSQSASSLLDFGDLIIEDTSTSSPTNRAQDVQASILEPKHGFGTLGALSKADQQPEKSRQEIVANKIKPKSLEPTPSPAVEDTTIDDHWDDFESWEEGGTTKDVQPSISIPPPLTSQSPESTIKTPPTNIPPPALVLSLFSPLFTSADSSFFQPLRQESIDVRHAIYNDPATLIYLRGLLDLATVCGRVIAGRKQRWKRDTILAQSMRIGPSGAGGVSGLKLTSIDKAETAKEDREAADAINAFQAHVGKFKSAIAEVKRLNGRDVGKTPDLRDPMPIKVAKEMEGGLKGNKACALCGLKREERVAKVDFEVEDSFGEWWVEDVNMHRACRNFWEQHRDVLKQR